jgi:CBS domain containing-hemolysin-like protein
LAPWVVDVLEIAGAGAIVAVNAFFVAAEFALVRVRVGQVRELVDGGRRFAAPALWLAERLEASLSACQLGVTMASLGLGWVGEPAVAHLLTPIFRFFGVTAEAIVHAAAFALAFTVITAVHIVIGELVPKIYAIRRPQNILLWCAPPLKAFYVLTYPLMVSLNGAASVLLRALGLGSAEQTMSHSEEEIRALVLEAHLGGRLSRAEHRLINAVFEFDDTVCRHIMVPRSEVVFFDAEQPLSECLALARRTRHTRYPVCDGSLDRVLGFIHMKDLTGVAPEAPFDMKSVLRPPRKVPENMPISKLLRHFQATHQLLAFVVDEYGNVIGIVTLENVLEKIVGEVDDEFDVEQPNVVAEGSGSYIVLGRTPVNTVIEQLGLELDPGDADTFSGWLTTRAERLLEAGDRIEIGAAVAEVLEVREARATRVRVSFPVAERHGAGPRAEDGEAGDS